MYQYWVNSINSEPIDYNFNSSGRFTATARLLSRYSEGHLNQTCKFHKLVALVASLIELVGNYPQRLQKSNPLASLVLSFRFVSAYYFSV